MKEPAVQRSAGRWKKFSAPKLKLSRSRGGAKLAGGRINSIVEDIA